MTGVSRFEDLVAWQKARELTKAIYIVTRKGEFAKDWGLAGQIQRAAVSVMSNLAEGFERSGQGEFHQFLSMSKASCAEVRSQLYVAFDIDYFNEDDFGKLMALAQEVARLTGALRAAVARQRDQQKKK